MKFALGIIFVLCSTIALGAKFESPDILIYSHLDYDWSNVLVSKIRKLLINYGVADPLSGNLVGDTKINQSKIGDLLPQNSKEMIRDFGNAVGLNIINSETQVYLKDISYDVKGFKTNLGINEPKPDGLTLGLDFQASEVNIAAEKLSFTLTIPGKNTSPVFRVEILRPQIKASQESLIQLYTKLKILNNPTNYKIQIIEANFSKMANELLNAKDSVELEYDRIIIPKVSLLIGNKTVNFSPEKIEKLIRSKHSEIKGILLAQVASVLNSNTLSAAYKTVEKYEIPKEVWFPPALPILQSMLNITKITSTNANSIEIHQNGDFCTLDLATKFQKDCLKNKVTQIAPSRINEEFHKKSLDHVKEVFARGDASIVASVSEDYINKLIVTTYDAGLWKEALEEAGVSLGAGKVILRFNKKGESALLIMDVVYKPTKIEKTLIGSKQVRFPLVLDIAMRIEIKNNLPVFIIKVHDVDTSDDTLMKGLPQEGIPSNVKDIPRFKKKVAQAIREKVISLKDKDMFELVIEQLKDLGVEKIDLESDGFGRMTAELGLKDYLEETVINK